MHFLLLKKAQISKAFWKKKSSYQRLCSILFLHLLSQLLEAGFQAVVERPQCFCDLISVDADPFGKVRNLKGGGGGRWHKMQVWATFI